MYEMNALIDELNARDYSERNRLSALLGNSQNIVMDSNGRKIQLKSAPSNMVDAIDYSRPIELFGGKKGFWHKTDPDAVVDAEGNIIRRYGPSREQQIADMKFRKAQQDIELGNLQQKKMQQELSNAGRAPAGYRYTQEGNMEVIPGGPADVKAQGKFNQDIASMNATESAMNELAQQANAIKEHGGLDAAVGWQSMFPTMPGSKAANAEALLETLRSKTAFGTLQAMRDASKTGGALGAVSEKELKLLESNLAALSKAQSPEQFRQQLDAIVKYAEGAKGRTREAFNMTHNGSQPQATGSSPVQAISEARAAIMKGAPREAVVKRLEQMGITNHGI